MVSYHDGRNVMVLIILAFFCEKLPADPSAASDFSKKLNYIIVSENLSPEQVYNMDETGLNFKLLPKKTLATAKETSASGFKASKERITVALCSNASGSHKLSPFVIGKSARARAFTNLNMASLPVYYRAQKSAWMNSYLFKEWFICEFIPKVQNHLISLKLPIKALLVLDNAPIHPTKLQCKGYPDKKLMFLPPNTTNGSRDHRKF